MNGVPQDLNLDDIIGFGLAQICLGPYSVNFVFESARQISAQGIVEVVENGNVIARWEEHEGWSSTKYHALLRATVSGYSVPNPRLLEIAFKGGLALRVHDSSSHLESFSIQPGNIFV